MSAGELLIKLGFANIAEFVEALEKAAKKAAESAEKTIEGGTSKGAAKGGAKARKSIEDEVSEGGAKGGAKAGKNIEEEVSKGGARGGAKARKNIENEVSKGGAEGGAKGGEAAGTAFLSSLGKIGPRIIGALGLAAMGATITSFVRQAVQEGINEIQRMERAMRLLEVSGVEASQGVREAIKAVAQETSFFTYGEVAEQVATLVDAGYTLQGAMEVVRQGALLAAGSVDVATGAMADLAQTTQQLSQALVGWGMSAQDAARMADVIAQTLVSGAGSFDDTAMALAEIGPLARAAGLSLETVAAAYAAVSAQGVQAVEVNGALRNVLDLLLAPTAEQAKLLKALGVEMDSSARRAKSAEQALQAIISAISNPTGAQIAAQLWGRSTLAVIMALGQARGAMAQYRQEIASADGVARQVAQTMSSTLVGSTQQMRAAMANAKAEIADALTPALTFLYTSVFPRLAAGFTDLVLKVGAFVGAIDRGVLAARQFSQATGIVFTNAKLAAEAMEIFSQLVVLEGEIARIARKPLVSQAELDRQKALINETMPLRRRLTQLAIEQNKLDQQAMARPVAPPPPAPPNVVAPPPKTSTAKAPAAKGPSDFEKDLKKIEQTLSIYESKLKSKGESFLEEYLSGVKGLIAELEKLKPKAKSLEEQDAWWHLYAALSEAVSSKTKEGASAVQSLGDRLEALKARFTLGRIGVNEYAGGLAKLRKEAEELAKTAKGDELPALANIVDNIKAAQEELNQPSKVGEVMRRLGEELAKIDRLATQGLPGFDATKEKISALTRAAMELASLGPVAEKELAKVVQQIKELGEQEEAAKAAKAIEEALAVLNKETPKTSKEIEAYISEIEKAIGKLEGVKGAEAAIATLKSRLDALRGSLEEVKRQEGIAEVLDELQKRLEELDIMAAQPWANAADIARQRISAYESAAERLLRLGDTAGFARLMDEAVKLRTQLEAEAAKAAEEEWKKSLTERLSLIRKEAATFGEEEVETARKVAEAIAGAIQEGLQKGYDISWLIPMYRDAKAYFEELQAQEERQKEDERTRERFEAALSSAERSIAEAEAINRLDLSADQEDAQARAKKIADAYRNAAVSLIRASLEFDGQLAKELIARAEEYAAKARELDLSIKAAESAERVAKATAIAQEALDKAKISFGSLAEEGIGGFEEKVRQAEAALEVLKEALREVSSLVGEDNEITISLKARIESLEGELENARATLDFAKELSGNVRSGLTEAINRALRGDAVGAVEAIGNALYRVVVDRLVAAFVGPIADAAASALAGVIGGALTSAAAEGGAAIAGALGGPIAALIVGLGAALVGWLIAGMGTSAGSNLKKPGDVEGEVSGASRVSASTPSITYKAETVVNISLEGALQDPTTRAAIRQMAVDATMETLRKLGIVR